MYAAFFGLVKEPFSIAPDPRFLFMSDLHREALAHLLYGLAGGGGFVLLTGEIGAGKTTVCRAFLEQMPQHTAVAYIVNPKLDPTELLLTVCEEFGVAVRPGAGAKEHVDALNRFLLERHAEGGRSVLIVDEAQGLSADVLEQLRLLTNLETAERKLLQIILIGQPELRELMARPELGQLAQRVIARWHLPALGPQQTVDYIRHRFAVAGPTAQLPFDAAALQRVHALTGGVPRRINLLCDRALLGAYAHGEARIGRRGVEQAAREVAGTAQGTPGPRGQPLAWAWAACGLAAGVGLTAAAALGWRERAPTGLQAVLSSPRSPQQAASAVAPAAGPQTGSQTAPVSASEAWAASGSGASAAVAPVAAAAGASAAASAPASPASPAGQGADALTALLTAAHPTEVPAWRELARRWNLALAEADPCAEAARARLVCFRSTGGLAVLRPLARPAWLALRGSGGGNGVGNGGGAAVERASYALLVALSNEQATLQVGDRRFVLPLQTLAGVWRGEFATFWRAPPGWQEPADGLADAAALDPWLQQRLPPAASAGAPLRQRVLAFQIAQGLPADGLAGPLTLMQLNRSGGVDEPRLADAAR